MENSNYNGGVGILEVVLCVFIILKLVGVITWPWVVVLIPLWITIGLYIILFIIAFIIGIKIKKK